MTRPQGAGGRAGVTRCPDCLRDAEDVDVARLSLHLVVFPSAEDFAEWRRRQGLRHVDDGPAEPAVAATLDGWDPDGRHAYAAPDGVLVETSGRRDGGREVSYLDLYGPAGAAERAYRALLDAAEYVKRELRTLALVEDIPDDVGEAVADEDRLVDRDVAADTVARLVVEEDDATSDGREPVKSRLYTRTYCKARHPPGGVGGDEDAPVSPPTTDSDGGKSAAIDVDDTPVRFLGADEVVPLSATAAETVADLPEGARYGPGVVLDGAGGDRR